MCSFSCSLPLCTEHSQGSMWLLYNSVHVTLAMNTGQLPSSLAIVMTVFWVGRAFGQVRLVPYVPFATVKMRPRYCSTSQQVAHTSCASRRHYHRDGTLHSKVLLSWKTEQPLSCISFTNMPQQRRPACKCALPVRFLLGGPAALISEPWLLSHL
jgi:hypothetical protein